MQVSHAADHITHAMIGGAKTIEFGISNSAEFFQILSSTLYSNQPLAVAREVLCNAWDAHIAAGITDIPVVVQITDEFVLVRDQGPGIHPDQMGPLYGMYGGTNKTNDGTQTGGFGLGCKSPFSYTDHFEVVSCHAGTKTIYNLSKSSAERMGKPGITPIISVPTQETGLQVKIPLKRMHDRATFEKYFSRVAANGEMNVVLNNEKVDPIPISASDYNWLITLDSPLDTPQKILVRYGNVVYPIERHASYARYYDQILSFIETLRSDTWRANYKIIFQAEPNTIAVTPSRESLSMQEFTIGTLTSLLKSFNVSKLQDEVGKEAEPLLEKQIGIAKAERRIGELLSTNRTMPGLPKHNVSDQNDVLHIGNLSDLTSQFTRRNYPSASGFYRKDISMRLDAAIELGLAPRGHLEFIKRHFLTPIGKRQLKIRKDRPYRWYLRRFIGRLYRDLDGDPVMERKRFQLVLGRSWSDEANFLDPHKQTLREYHEYLPILRKVVVLSFSRRNLWDRVKQDPEVLKHGTAEQIFFYHAPVAKTKIQKVRDFFTSRGFKLVDFTTDDAWEKHKTPKPIVDLTKPKKPKAEGYAALKGCFHPEKDARVDNCFLEGAPRIKDPKQFLLVEYSRAEFRQLTFGNFQREEARLVVKLFGDTCAVVRSEPAAKKLKEKGVLDLNHYVVDYVCQQVSTSPTFLEYWEEDLSRALGNPGGKLLEDEKLQVAATLFDIPEVRKMLGLQTSLNDHDRMVLSLWRGMLTYWHRFDRAGMENKTAQDALTAVNQVAINLKLAAMAHSIRNGSLISLLDKKQLDLALSGAKAAGDDRLARIAQLTKIILLG